MRILVADKNPEVRSLIGARLKARHYHVLEAETSEDVLRFLDREKIDLILISTDMERLSGSLLIEKIRQRPNLTTLPIILLTEEEKIAEMIMSHDRGFDDFITKPFNPLVLQLRVAINISRARHRVEANALTHLPGNHAIERLIRRKIEKNEKFSVIYIDINHFKSFNDRYGFEKGDDVIRQTARILMETARETSPDGEAFIGHIGGDDFIVVTKPEYEESFARKFMVEFDRIILTYYHEKDQTRGHIRTKNRQGKVATFPLMSCSVAACNNLIRDYKSLGEIAADAAEVKSFLKSQKGSHYLRDRRSTPAKGAEEAIAFLEPEMKEKAAGATHSDPLGQILMNAGLINQEQLTLALKAHLESGQRLGQILIGMNAVKSEDVGRMLEKKLHIPYVSLKTLMPAPEILKLFPLDFVRSYRAIPLAIEGNWVGVGLCEPFDIRTLDSIERITGLKPVPSLVLEDEFEYFIQQHLDLMLRLEKVV